MLTGLGGLGRARDVLAEKPGQSTRSQRFALLVGINEYADASFSELSYCVNDIVAMHARLEQLGYMVISLHDHASENRLRPTRDNVEAEMIAICQSLRSEDTLLVHFACHGRLVAGDATLITADTRAANMDTRALKVTWVEQTMRASAAKQLILILDACHAGAEVGRGGGDEGFTQNVYESATGFALLAGSTARQVAHEDREKRHGVFSYFILEALSGAADAEGKGFVTVDDLKRYVLDGVRRWSLKHGGLQEPTARSEGVGDIIVADLRVPVRRPPAVRKILLVGSLLLSGVVMAIAMNLWISRQPEGDMEVSALRQYVQDHCVRSGDAAAVPPTVITQIDPVRAVAIMEPHVKECPLLVLTVVEGLTDRALKNPGIWRVRGRALYALKHVSEALGALQRAAELAPIDAAVVHDIARCKKVLGLEGYEDDLRKSCVLGDATACQLL